MNSPCKRADGFHRGSEPSHGFHSRSHTWRRKRRYILHRVIGAMFFFALLILVTRTALDFVVTRLLGGSQQDLALLWISGCGLVLILPALIVAGAMRAYRRWATPLADVMAASEAVAEGDLSVRVPDEIPGEFGRLARTFNNMTAELERSDRMRRNLTADVAHELRTPLHIIQGNLEGILDGVYAADAEHINATLEETRALSRLVNDLQTLALAEGGQLQLHFAPVDLSELLRDLETSFRPLAEAAGIDLVVDLAPRLQGCSIQGDAGRIDQVLTNLVTNAIRHAPGGRIDIRAALAGDHVQLAVHDNGEGIAAEELPFVFERFWRGDRARTHAAGVGGGLGLAIARQLVQAHGGTIDVESQLGAGSTFTVTLPIG